MFLSLTDHHHVRAVSMGHLFTQVRHVFLYILPERPSTAPTHTPLGVWAGRQWAKNYLRAQRDWRISVRQRIAEAPVALGPPPTFNQPKSDRLVADLTAAQLKLKLKLHEASFSGERDADLHDVSDHAPTRGPPQASIAKWFNKIGVAMGCRRIDCNRRARTSGWGTTHYRRLRSGQEMDAHPTLRPTRRR